MIVNIFIVSIFSFIFIKFLIANSNKFHLLDIPNERSHHCSVIPRGAGIGFVISFFLTTSFFHFDLILQYWYIYVAITIVFAIGVVDDRYEVSAKLKFIAIFIATFLLWLNGLTIDTIGTWFGYEVTLPMWLALPFSMFALAGFTNALNLIDGLDGLAGSVSVVIITFFFFIGYTHHDTLMMSISLFTIASLLGFLVLNWNPAKIFMGDSGSLTLGFIISVLSLLSLKYIHPIVVIYLAALPILDTLVVMIRRIRRGKSPFSPDKTHIHHILVKFFENDVKRTVIFLVVLQIVFSSIGYILIELIQNDLSGTIPFFALVIFGMLFILFYMIFTGIKKRQLVLDKGKK